MPEPALFSLAVSLTEVTRWGTASRLLLQLGARHEIGEPFELSAADAQLRLKLRSRASGYGAIRTLRGFGVLAPIEHGPGRGELPSMWELRHPAAWGPAVPWSTRRFDALEAIDAQLYASELDTMPISARRRSARYRALARGPQPRGNGSPKGKSARPSAARSDTRARGPQPRGNGPSDAPPSSSLLPPEEVVVNPSSLEEEEQWIDDPSGRELVDAVKEATGLSTVYGWPRDRLRRLAKVADDKGRLAELVGWCRDPGRPGLLTQLLPWLELRLEGGDADIIASRPRTRRDELEADLELCRKIGDDEGAKGIEHELGTLSA